MQAATSLVTPGERPRISVRTRHTPKQWTLYGGLITRCPEGQEGLFSSKTKNDRLRIPALYIFFSIASRSKMAVVSEPSVDFTSPIKTSGHGNCPKVLCGQG